MDINTAKNHRCRRRQKRIRKNISWTKFNRNASAASVKILCQFDMISNYHLSRTTKRYNYLQNLRRCMIISNISQTIESDWPINNKCFALKISFVLSIYQINRRSEYLKTIYERSSCAIIKKNRSSYFQAFIDKI